MKTPLPHGCGGSISIEVRAIVFDWSKSPIPEHWARPPESVGQEYAVQCECGESTAFQPTPETAIDTWNACHAGYVIVRRS